ncbi:uncharacterized protein LOC115216359 [Argonauta hians]
MATNTSTPKSSGISSSVTILRPKSPTKSVQNKNFITFIETNINETLDEDSKNPTDEILCAFSAPFLFRSPNGSFLPDVNMQMYWCNFCPFKCQEKQKMIEHSQTHRFKCNYCPVERYQRKEIIKHSVKEHSEYNQIKNALKSCALLDDYLEQKEMTIKEQHEDTEKIVNEKSDSKNNSVGNVTSTECCQSPVQDVNSTKEAEDTNPTVNVMETPSNSQPPETPDIKPVIRHEENVTTNETVPVILDNFVNSTMNNVFNTTSKTNTDMLVSGSTDTGPLILSVESLKKDEPDESSQSVSYTEVSTTDLNVSNKRKKDSVSDSDSYPDDDDVDPDYNPEEGKPSRPVKRKCSARIRTSDQSKKAHISKLAPGTKYWRCKYCKSRSSSIEKLVKHSKAKHSEKPIRFIALEVGENGEIKEATDKPTTKNDSTTSKVTDKNASKSTVDVDTGDRQYSCFYCESPFSNMNEIRQHMFKEHSSRKFYCIDNNLKKQNKEYRTFFCCRHKCNFARVDPKEFLNHIEKCTPIPTVPDDPGAKPTGLQLTCAYAKKLISKSKSEGDSSKSKSSSSVEKESTPAKPVTKVESESTPTKPVQSAEKDNTPKKPDTSNSKVFEIAKDLKFQCHSCSFTALDKDSMKLHMVSKHSNLSMSALVRKENSLQFYFFCSVLDCNFVAEKKSELEIHSKNMHGDNKVSSNIGVKVKQEIPTTIKTEDPIKKSNVAYMPAYECLYCESSCISTSLTNMKRHVQEAHPSEVIVVRDCIAYKCKRPSRIYVCDSDGCIFNDLDYKDYLTHLITHKKCVLYQCLSCPSWASLNKEDFVKHARKEPNKKHSLSEVQPNQQPDAVS